MMIMSCVDHVIILMVSVYMDIVGMFIMHSDAVFIVSSSINQ